ncbi:MAG: mannose-1-phosphate guanylyltransferase/mannose-6-phosphate isomerase [Gammaproteobacteria bacterium]|nr:mannose-1-phosphate guanylyltransferase/mannose-6-phosphate isomerase [Gammaproteobacteria bacterium]
MQLVPIILAGGGGTRLWPLSRTHYPKQFLAVEGKLTLLQGTLQRIVPGHPATAGAESLDITAPMIVCNEEHRFLVGEQARLLGQKVSRIVLEPVGRNTAPALTCAALVAAADGQDPLLLMMPADHLIKDLATFRAAVEKGAAHAAAGHIVTFGIVPSAPETGYGYIQLGAEIASGDADPKAHALAGFREKPDLATAESYLADGGYRWNAGIFLMKASAWLAAIGEYRPDILKHCDAAVREAATDGDFFRLARESFEAGPSDSIDYAVMERIAKQDPARGCVVSLEAGWSDVGAWSSIWEVSQKNAEGNVVRGDVCAIDCRDNVIFSESRLVAAIGCEELVIVETPDAVMVTPKSRAQDVKAIVDWLNERSREERQTHRRVYRPWGSYEGVDFGERFQVKRLVVKPGASLSLQMHHHRAEHWIVVKGTAKVTRDGEEFLISENQSTYIPIGAKHRLENPGTIPLEIIEVQSGAYLGEDDIVRFQDKYNRVK